MRFADLVEKSPLAPRGAASSDAAEEAPGGCMMGARVLTYGRALSIRNLTVPGPMPDRRWVSSH